MQLVLRSSAEQQLALDVRRRISERQPEQEAIQLRLGQGIGPGVLVRVLRGEHQERRRQDARAAVHRHLPFRHRLQEAALRARRGAVDLVGENQVREQRAGLEHELPGPLIEHGDAGDVAGQ